MEELDDISMQLRILLDKYGFRAETLASYLGLSVWQLREVAAGSLDCLPQDHMERFRCLNKITFLYLIPCDGADKKVNAFLEVLISYHGLSEKTIAKMANVREEDVQNMLKCPMGRVSDQTKYKIAAAAMCLRFFLKENEPQ